MKKVLFFDMLSPTGHKVFNDIHIRALNQLGEVYTIFKEGYYKYNYPQVFHYLDIPQSFFKEDEGYFKSRFRLAKMLRWVWKKISKEKWDYIIFPSYDPLAFLLSGRFKNAIVIDHNTIGLLDNRLLGFPLCHLNKNIKHVVFNEEMKLRLIEKGIKNVSIVPHGFLTMERINLTEEEEKTIRQKYKLNIGDKFIFAPSLSYSTTDVIGNLAYNEEFNSFLKANSLKLITKSLVKRESMSNIIIIDGFLPTEEYNYLFLHSYCIALFYSQEFKYRTSGVLNECFANNIPCVFTDCDALKVYMPYISSKQCVFNDIEGLQKAVLSVSIADNKGYYKDIEKINDPLEAWRAILK